MTAIRRSATCRSRRTVAPLVLAICALGATLVPWLQVRAAELPSYPVALEGHRISPSRLEVPAGTRIKLVLHNASGGAAEFEGREVRVEKVLGPGAASFVVLPPLKPGRYRFFDEFHPDAPDLVVIARCHR